MNERIEVLVATMNQTDFSLLDKMNIQTDAVIGNQCNVNKISHFKWEGHDIKWLSFNEKGVGLNRNNALMRAKGDICLFADDDMIYVDKYTEIVKEAFTKLKKADVIVFNLYESTPTRYIIPKIKKVSWFNYLRYGTARIAIRRSSIKKNGIFFNQCFGGGTEHPNGEDSLFLTDCLKKGLKIYAYPEYIATLTEERESTCKPKSIEEYLLGQGAVFYQISNRLWRILCLQDAIRRHKSYNMGWYSAYKIMVKGR